MKLSSKISQSMNKLIIANWKAFLKTSEAINLAKNIPMLENIVISPASMHLALIRGLCPEVRLASQDISSLSYEHGAYTGETTAKMLDDIGAEYAIIGHSERRSSGLDNADNIAKKVQNALSSQIIPIICVGETKADRDNGQYLDIIADQLRSLNLQTDQDVIIAYEPIWSIGTDVVPSSSEISEVMEMIRSTLKIAGKLILVYGGSVNAKNAKEIVNIPGVDGVLIGKASTDLVQFKEIIRQIC